MTTVAAERTRRLREIRILVREHAVASQDELLDLLAARGHDVTQATLSRDLRELRISRLPVEGGYRYAQSGLESGPLHGTSAVGEARLRSVAALEVVAIGANESCVVVRTLPARAQGVAAWLDQLALSDVLATVAGDDTILVVPRSVRRTARLESELAGLLGLSSPRSAAKGSRRVKESS